MAGGRIGPDEIDEEVQFVRRDASGIARHQLLAAARELVATRIQDLLAQPLVVRGDRATVGQGDPAAVEPREARRLHGGIRLVAAGAAVGLVEGAAGGELALLRPGMGQPVLIVAGVHEGDLAAHHRVVGAAIFGAVEVVGPDPVGLEPHLGVAVGQGGDLHPHRRQVEGVDHVLADDPQLDRLADGQVQVVDLGLAGGMLELPHPLAADRLDHHRVGGWVARLDVELRPPDEEHQGEQERDQHPADLDEVRADAGGLPVGLRALAVAQGEPRDRDEDRHGQRERQHREGEDQLVGLDRRGRGGGGPELKRGMVRGHRAARPSSRERPIESCIARSIGMWARVRSGSR